MLSCTCITLSFMENNYKVLTFMVLLLQLLLMEFRTSDNQIIEITHLCKLIWIQPISIQQINLFKSNITGWKSGNSTKYLKSLIYKQLAFGSNSNFAVFNYAYHIFWTRQCSMVVVNLLLLTIHFIIKPIYG